MLSITQLNRTVQRICDE